MSIFNMSYGAALPTATATHKITIDSSLNLFEVRLENAGCTAS